MTDRFKDLLNDMPHRQSDKLWTFVSHNYELFRDALIKATESEQLRKERDELAKDFTWLIDRLDELTDQINNYKKIIESSIELAKKVNENGNA